MPWVMSENWCSNIRLICSAEWTCSSKAARQRRFQIVRVNLNFGCDASYKQCFHDGSDWKLCKEKTELIEVKKMKMKWEEKGTRI